MILIERVRPAQAKELSEIAFAAKAHWGYPQRWLALWRPQLTFSSAYFEANESWAAYLEDIPVGFYTLQEKQDHAWLENLWVSPASMGQGIGKALFRHALGQARQQGYSRLQLVADPNAADFYQKMGMHRIGEETYILEGQTRAIPIMKMDLENE